MPCCSTARWSRPLATPEVYPHQETYYLHYLISQDYPGDGFRFANSLDRVHWDERDWALRASEGPVSMCRRPSPLLEPSTCAASSEGSGPGAAFVACQDIHPPVCQGIHPPSGCGSS